MTPTELAHIQNILDDPLNDGIEGPRWVYADWLDERGHGDDRERAEFIRLQIAHDHDPSVGFTWSPKWPGADLPGVVFRRGFPSSISCTLATLFGGECGTCRGVVIVDELPEQEANYSYCPECKNSGHTEGIARDVFGRWPVTKTRLTCREPFNADNEEWQWFRVRNRVQTPAGIPEELFDAMEGCFPAINGRFIARFHSRESALAALSRAAVNYGRERAGLRPIPWGDQ